MEWKPNSRMAGFSKPNGGVGRWLNQMALNVEVEAKVLAPVKTGALKRSIKRTRAKPYHRGLFVTVTAHKEYAAPVHEGVSAHTITSTSPMVFPRRGGGLVVTDEVKQPARKGNPFLWKALRRVLVPPAVVAVPHKSGL